MRPLLLLSFSGFVRSVLAYDPLNVATQPVAPVDFTVHDAKRNRDIPLRVYLPEEKKPAPVVLFSHGLGGTREGSVFLGRHWSARGYAAVFLQHPGSDDSVWKDKPFAERVAAMKAAASLQNFMLRVQDVPAVLDQLALWQKSEDHALAGRLDMEHLGMSGHSFGAVTTQAVSGQSLPTGGRGFTDPRIKAAIVLSPTTPQRGSAEQAFGKVKIPWLLMTGTHDIAKIGGQTIGAADMASRLGVFPALPPGDKYELVLNDAAHFIFTDRPELDKEAPRNPNHHRVILALSTAFWDAYLKADTEAKAWFNGEGPRSVMEVADKWQRK